MYILSKKNKGCYKEKGSIFHSIVYPINNVDIVKSLLLDIKINNPNANHICYGYRVLREKCIDEYASDSGEPTGSAGLPILKVLKQNKIINSVIFVIRYFGGKKLGISGLIHAYTSAAKDSIEGLSLKAWYKKEYIYISYEYELEGQVASIIQKNDVNIIEEKFEKKITLKLELNKEYMDSFIIGIKEKTSNRIIINKK